MADHDITAMSEPERDAYRRDRVGFVYQSFNLIGNLSAVDNVLLPYIPAGVTPELRSKAAELLKEVGLGHRMKLRPRQMSGGEQQRVAIARALIRDPIVIFADEPTGNLDRAGGDRIIQLLRDRQRQGNRTLVIVTHDRRFITPDDIVLEIEDGRLKGEPSPSPSLTARRREGCGKVSGMPQDFRDVDPRELRLPSRPGGADPYKLQRQIARFGASSTGMPPLWVYEAADGVLVVYNGVTRATRIARLAPGTTVRVEVVGKLRRAYSGEPKIGDSLP